MLHKVGIQIRTYLGRNGADLDLGARASCPVATAQMQLRLLWNGDSRLGGYELTDDIDAVMEYSLIS